MLSKNEATQIIYSAIDAVNADLPADARVGKSPSTHLVGEKGALDSLGLINLTMAIEKSIREKWQGAITLVTQEIMMAEKSPFETVDTLAQYMSGLNLGAKKNG